MMSEELWFMLLFWFITLFVGIRYKQFFFTSLSSILALFLGFLLLQQVYVWLGLTFIFCGLYLLYYAVFKLMGGSRRK